MNAKLDVKRILIFLAFAFGIAWIVGLAVYLTGGLKNSPELIPGSGITLAVALLAVLYMWAPALAHIFTRLITREGWQGTFLRPNFRRGWPFWIAAWFLPAVLTILGAALFFALFPRTFDASLASTREALSTASQRTGQSIPLSPWLVVIINTTIGVLIAPLVNSLFTFGEEFGWRSYLLNKMMPLGGRKAMLLMGLIWGVWHWPVIAMGHNYGVYTLDYPGAPWTGMLAMVWFTFVGGTFLGWLALRSSSVWPAVIAHAAMNGIGGVSLLLTLGQPNLVLGPTPAGVIASAAFTLTTLWIFASRKGLSPAEISSVAVKSADAAAQGSVAR